jgi:hypothetical protein
MLPVPLLEDLAAAGAETLATAIPDSSLTPSHFAERLKRTKKQKR